jgi:hypothetical protein
MTGEAQAGQRSFTYDTAGFRTSEVLGPQLGGRTLETVPDSFGRRSRLALRSGSLKEHEQTYSFA